MAQAGEQSRPAYLARLKWAEKPLVMVPADDRISRNHLGLHLVFGARWVQLYFKVYLLDHLVIVFVFGCGKLVSKASNIQNRKGCMGLNVFYQCPTNPRM